MNKRSLLLAVLAVGCGGSHVGGGQAAGAEGGACYPNGTCNTGLTCASHLCVKLPGDADASGPGRQPVDGSTGRTVNDGSTGNRGLDASVFGQDGSSILVDSGDVHTPCPVTAYTGDDQCLPVPSPENGFQLHYGPSSYDDPNEVLKYLVPPGAEGVSCVYVKVPTDRDVHVGAVHVRLRPALYRLTVFADPTDDLPDGTAPATGCRRGGAYPMVQSVGPSLDVAFGDSPPAPEYQGAALPVTARLQTFLEVHAVNTTNEPLLAEGWVNFATVPEADVRMNVSPLWWIGGVGMSIPPATTSVVTAKGNCSGGPPGDWNLLGFAPETHAHTQRVSASTSHAGGGTFKIYESYDWQDPLFIRYDSTRANPAPDPATRTPGGFSGQLVVHPGDPFSFECEVNNDTSNVTLRYANLLYTGEKCDLFGYYVPGSVPYQCISQ